MKKIVFVIEQLSAGGAERVTSELANFMSNTYEVHIISFCKNTDKEYHLDSNIVRHNLEIAEKNKILRAVKRVMGMKKEIHAIKPSCVVSLAMPITNIYVSIALFGGNVPLILSERNDPKRYPKSKIERSLRIFIYKKCRGIVFQTEEAKDYFSKDIRKKSVIISNPINSLLPERYEGEREPIIVNFCRLAKQKNLDLLIDAFCNISKDFPEYSLHIYGDGPEKEHLIEKINLGGLEGKVILHSFSVNIYEEIKKAALFVSTSNYEGISNSMLEALALGISTICTDCPAGGARETIENGVNGFLVPVNDQESLINAMSLVLSNGKLAKQFSDEGFKIRDKNSIERIATQWITYIESII